MDDEEYLELARAIRDQLLEMGLDDIADFSNYAADESEERPPPDGKTLIKLMFASFDRYLAANAAETVTTSLEIIAENIDEGERPTQAFVYASDEWVAAAEGRKKQMEIGGLGNMAEMRKALKDLERRLLDDTESAEPKGSM